MAKPYQRKPCRSCGGDKGTYPNGRSRGVYCEMKRGIPSKVRLDNLELFREAESQAA